VEWVARVSICQLWGLVDDLSSFAAVKHANEDGNEGATRPPRPPTGRATPGARPRKAPRVSRSWARIRTAASRRPLAQCPSASFRLEHHHGVPISAIIFGGRRTHLTPLVYEAFDWDHGVFVGATMLPSGTPRSSASRVKSAATRWPCSPSAATTRATISSIG
jgi:hypothetical protein